MRACRSWVKPPRAAGSGGGAGANWKLLAGSGWNEGGASSRGVDGLRVENICVNDPGPELDAAGAGGGAAGAGAGSRDGPEELRVENICVKEPGPGLDAADDAAG